MPLTRSWTTFWSMRARYGLEAKPPESLDGGRALGLVIVKDHTGCLQFRRGNGIPRVPEKMMRRQVFSLCGQLTGHYPMGGWLRIACSFLKRECGAGLWGAPVSERVAAMLLQLVERVEREDRGTFRRRLEAESGATRARLRSVRRSRSEEP